LALDPTKAGKALNNRKRAAVLPVLGVDVQILFRNCRRTPNRQVMEPRSFVAPVVPVVAASNRAPGRARSCAAMRTIELFMNWRRSVARRPAAGTPCGGTGLPQGRCSRRAAPRRQVAGFFMS
jgi:hypothetical protein